MVSLVAKKRFIKFSGGSHHNKIYRVTNAFLERNAVPLAFFSIFSQIFSFVQ